MHSPREILLRRLETIHDLPSLPSVIQQIEAAAANESSSAKDIADIIETDPPMAARVLRLANSSYYRAVGQDCLSVRHAVARLGLKEVRKLCLAIAAMRIFVRPSAFVDLRAFWHHALTVGSATRTIANLTHGVSINGDEAFVAGLLHEIGSLVLDQFFPKIYGIVFREAERTQRPIHLIEQEYLKINHAEIGSLLMEQWNLPGHLVAATRHHHNPSEAPTEYRALAQLVHLADFACTEQGLPGPGEQFLAVASARAWRDLGLRPENAADLLDEIASEVDRSNLFLSLIA